MEGVPIPTKKVAQVGRPYVVLRVLLRDDSIFDGGYKLENLEHIINEQCTKGYRLHTMSCNNDGKVGISAILIFERFDLR